MKTWMLNLLDPGDGAMMRCQRFLYHGHFQLSLWNLTRFYQLCAGIGLLVSYSGSVYSDWAVTGYSD